MKRKKLLLLLAVSSLLVFFAGAVHISPSAITINKISVQPGKLNTLITLEADAAPGPVNTYYSKESSKTIVLELNGVAAETQPQILSGDSPLVANLKFEKTGGDQARLLVHLHEQVPYRVFGQGNAIILELNRFQKGGYVIEPVTQELLDKRDLPTVMMNKLDVREKDGELEFTAGLTDKPLYQVFTLERPLRLVVDVFNTIYDEPASVIPVEKYGLKKVRVAQFQLSDPYSITRMVFDLDEPRLYDLHAENNEIVVSFSKNIATVLTASSRSAAPAPAKPAAPPPAALSTPKQADIVPAEQPKPVATAVPNVSKKPNGDKVNDSYAPAPAKRRTGQEIDPVQEQAQEERYKPKTIAESQVKYTGEIITLKFKDADLRDVILYLGDFAKLNVVFDPEVRGVVTCNLEDVPWDQALDILLRNNKLGKVLEGNVLRIAPVSVLTREDEEQRKLRESKELAGPVIVKTVTLSYSKARDVMALLNAKKSPRGEITIDERTNTLIISDVRESLDLLERLISVLDTPTPQVSIEARIVEATSTFIRNLGIQWGWRGVADPYYGNQTTVQFPNKVLADGSLIPQGIVTKGIGGPLGGYAINLPAPAFTTAMGFSFANILDTFRLDLAISALETSGEGRIISSPKVTTQNNQAAEIIQGRQIPVQTVANFTVTTRYINAALELRATPQITAEGTIIMTIDIRNNAADFANLVNGIPPITTQSASTTVMIPDGGTTVIGGIYRSEDSITRERVPFLHSIPIIGNLFKSFARTKQNRELLIFITPRIIK
jgi:type IV pilus secretin PilQ/predicted competence protein